MEDSNHFSGLTSAFRAAYEQSNLKVGLISAFDRHTSLKVGLISAFDVLDAKGDYMKARRIWNKLFINSLLFLFLLI